MKHKNSDWSRNLFNAGKIKFSLSARWKSDNITMSRVIHSQTEVFSQHWSYASLKIVIRDRNMSKLMQIYCRGRRKKVGELHWRVHVRFDWYDCAIDLTKSVQTLNSISSEVYLVAPNRYKVRTRIWSLPGLITKSTSLIWFRLKLSVRKNGMFWNQSPLTEVNWLSLRLKASILGRNGKWRTRSKLKGVVTHGSLERCQVNVLHNHDSEICL